MSLISQPAVYDIHRHETRPLPARQWNDFVASHPQARLYHRAEWGGLIACLFGHETYSWYALDADGSLAGVLPLVRLRSRLFGDFQISMPYLNYGGALGRDPLVEEALMHQAAAAARAAGCAHVEFRDLCERGGAWPARTDKVVMELALPDGEAALWKALGSKLRAQVKRPQREGMAVARGGVELVDDFYRVFARNMRDLGTPVYPKSFFQAIALVFAAHTTLLVVRYGKRPVAAGFLLRDGARMEIPWASSLREYNRQGVNMLLYWEVLREALAQGCSCFDFGRSSVDSGTYRFKQQWGATPRQLYWHYWLRSAGEPPRLNPHNPKYRLAVHVWSRLPVTLANWLGPVVVKGLP